MVNSPHAESVDVRVVSISVAVAQTQGQLIDSFCMANSLKLKYRQDRGACLVYQ